MHTVITPIQHSAGNLRVVRQEKDLQISKKEVELSLLADDMILHIENPKDSTKKPVVSNKFSKVAKYKINIQNGISLAVQWLRICFAMQRTWVSSLVRERRSHMLWGN